jgi:hypothetical protein
MNLNFSVSTVDNTDNFVCGSCGNKMEHFLLSKIIVEQPTNVFVHLIARCSNPKCRQLFDFEKRPISLTTLGLRLTIQPELMHLTQTEADK